MENATINCPTCGSIFPAGASFCPKCGYVVPVTRPQAAEFVPPAQVVYVEQAPATPSWIPWITGIVLTLLVAGGIALWNMGYLGGSAALSSETSSRIVEASPAPAAQQPDINITLPPANNVAAPPPAQDISITLPPGATPPATPPPVPPASGQAAEIVSVRAEALETGQAEWKYGYTLKLRNTSASDKPVQLKISFVDGQGYIVDDVLTGELVIPANSEKSFAGADMIRADLAATIKSVKAEFR